MGFVIGFVVRNGFRLCSVWGFSVVFVAHGARKARRGVCDSAWNGFGFWFGSGGLLAFVAGEARHGVWDSGFVVGNGPQPWPWPLIFRKLEASSHEGRWMAQEGCYRSPCDSDA